MGGWGGLQAALPMVVVSELQPFQAQVRRVADALTVVGAPLSASERATIDAALAETDPTLASAKVQAVLDARTLVGVHVNPEMRVKVQPGEAKPTLVEGGWTAFLVKVHNEAGTTAALRVKSPQAERLHEAPSTTVADRWLATEFFTAAPLRAELGGLPLEYRVLQLYSRDRGPREAKLAFDVGQGTQDLGFRGETDVLFQCSAAEVIRLRILDEHGAPTTGSLNVTDALGHVFPAPSKRLAPDFFFHTQVYRGDGEELRLPVGKYTVEFRRGPESEVERRVVEVRPGPQ